jgi:NAD(P)-dependent dehydrogenase (short-subunit alcohol dehydrogenase family)
VTLNTRSVHDRKEKYPMSERVAIVVGTGGELGRVTAEKLAAAGFTVAGVDRSEDQKRTSVMLASPAPGPSASTPVHDQLRLSGIKS